MTLKSSVILGIFFLILQFSSSKIGTKEQIFYLHIFKTGGSSIRSVIRDVSVTMAIRAAFAVNKGCDGSVSVRTADQGLGQGKSRFSYFCLEHGRLKNQFQASMARKFQIFAGHFWFGIHRDVSYECNPSYMTVLRQPLSRAASAALYAARDRINSEEDCIKALHTTFIQPIEEGIYARSVTDIFSRLSGKSKKVIKRDSPDEIYVRRKVRHIKKILDSFDIVGLTEKLDVFLEMFIDLFWKERKISNALNGVKERSKRVSKNTFPFNQTLILEKLEERYPGILQKFNETIQPEWEIYAHAQEIFSNQCETAFGNSVRCRL